MDKSSNPEGLCFFIYKMGAVSMFLPGWFWARSETMWLKMIYKLLRNCKTQAWLETMGNKGGWEQIFWEHRCREMKKKFKEWGG